MTCPSQRRLIPTHHVLYPFLVASAVAVMCLRIGLTWRVFNDTVDEPYHLGAGVAMFEAGRHVYGIQHPPLPRLVAALPLVVGGGIDPRAADPVFGSLVDDLRAFEIGHYTLVGGQMPYWTALVRARAAMLVFPIVAVVYVYFLGKYIANPLMGCAAAVLFSTDATLLGHGSWITTDVAACAGLLAATYHGVQFVACPKLGRAVGAGLAVGLALACKFSCALALPALFLIWLCRGRRALATAGRVTSLGALSAAIAPASLWAVYFFDVGRVDNLPLLSHHRDAVQELPSWLRRTTLPMPTAIAGYALLADHNEQGHWSYLNGEVGTRARWYYFPEAIAIKSPAALLVGIACAGIALARARGRPWLRLAVLAIPCGVFLAASMTARINIGVRHVLPAIPLLYLLVAFCLVRARIVGRALLVLLVVASALETAAAHPDYLPFFNVFVGGPRHGSKYLLDSNVDWGQDIWRLKTWLDTNAGGRVVTTRLFGNPRLHEWPRDGGYMLEPPDAPPRGLFAVSKNFSHDVYKRFDRDESGNLVVVAPVDWVRQLKPVAQIGSSIDVYDLDAPDALRLRGGGGVAPREAGD